MPLQLPGPFAACQAVENVAEVLDQVLKVQAKIESLIGKLVEFKDDETKKCLEDILLINFPEIL